MRSCKKEIYFQGELLRPGPESYPFCGEHPGQKLPFLRGTRVGERMRAKAIEFTFPDQMFLCHERALLNWCFIVWLFVSYCCRCFTWMNGFSSQCETIWPVQGFIHEIIRPRVISVPLASSWDTKFARFSNDRSSLCWFDDTRHSHPPRTPLEGAIIIWCCMR